MKKYVIFQRQILQVLLEESDFYRIFLSKSNDNRVHQCVKALSAQRNLELTFWISNSISE